MPSKHKAGGCNCCGCNGSTPCADLYTESGVNGMKLRLSTATTTLNYTLSSADLASDGVYGSCHIKKTYSNTYDPTESLVNQPAPTPQPPFPNNIVFIGGAANYVWGNTFSSQFEYEYPGAGWNPPLPDSGRCTCDAFPILGTEVNYVLGIKFECVAGQVKWSLFLEATQEMEVVIPFEVAGTGFGARTYSGPETLEHSTSDWMPDSWSGATPYYPKTYATGYIHDWNPGTTGADGLTNTGGSAYEYGAYAYGNCVVKKSTSLTNPTTITLAPLYDPTGFLTATVDLIP